MSLIEWAGSFSKRDREAAELCLSSLGIQLEDVRIVMRCLGPEHNLLLFTGEEIVTVFVPVRRKQRSLEPAVIERFQMESLQQIAYKTRSTRDSDIEPRRLYILQHDERVIQLGLLLLESKDGLDKLAALVDPLPVAIDGKVVQIQTENVSGPSGKGLFAPIPVKVPEAHSVPTDPTNVKLFVSHASEDCKAAIAITEEFEKNGVDTWLATRDIHAGRNYAEQIYNAMVSASHLVVLLSPTSVDSVHVQREVNLAIDQGKSLLPVVVAPDADFLASLPAAWKYWLGVVQVVPYSSPATSVSVLLRSIRSSN